MLFDEKNIKILELLQENSRISFTDISFKVSLSVDSVKKRVEKLKKNNLFYFKIQLRPRHFGYPNIVEINIKLGNYNEQKYDKFIDYIINHPRITQVIKLSGNFDLKIVFISKDYNDQGLISKEIRNKFSEIIYEWSESLTTQVLKFEKYDLKKLI